MHLTIHAMKISVCFVLCLLQMQSIFCQTNIEFCGIKNKTTFSGEVLNYKVYYTLAGAYFRAGEATFSNTLSVLNYQPVYHVIGSGKTFKNYDWFFKVRDVYESYLDTATMLPLKFTRNVSEGKNRIYNNVQFNQKQGTALSTNGLFEIPPCIQDVLSAIYYARNIDFNIYKIGDKIPLTLFLDDEVHPIYIRYLGKQKLSTSSGVYNVIKFRPMLIEGTLFKGGEKMTVYVTDDERKIPILIETPILVGSVKVYWVK